MTGKKFSARSALLDVERSLLFDVLQKGIRALNATMID
jgi:hypothetical protein